MGICASGSVASALDQPTGPPPFDCAEITNRYDVDFARKPLGEGMSGTVWKCTEKSSGQLCALKQMVKARMDADDLILLKNEIDLLRELKHPHILEYHTHVDGKENIFIVTELLQGGELFDSIVEHEHYTEYDAREVMRSLMGIIKYMHNNNVVHHDLKAENLMLSDPRPGKGEKREQDLSAIKLIDFGLSAKVPNEFGGVSMGAGTPSYMAPEYFVKKLNYGKPADCWAMGVLTFVLLVGYMPFAGDSDSELYRAIKKADIQYDKDDWVNISSDAWDFIKACLTVDVRKRMNVNQMKDHAWMKVNCKDSAHGGVDLSETQVKIRLQQNRIRMKKAINAVVFLNQQSRHYMPASEVVVHDPVNVQ